MPETTPLRGYHVLFDGELSDIPTARVLRAFLAKAIAATKLHAIRPTIVSVRTPDWTAFVVIAESHISAHGRGKAGFVDVFSCRCFDADAMLAVLVEALPGQWSMRSLERGAPL